MSIVFHKKVPKNFALSSFVKKSNTSALLRIECITAAHAATHIYKKERKMKRTVEKILLFTAACIMCIVFLASCSTAGQDANDLTQASSHSELTTSAASQSSPNDITTDSYEEKIAYYMTLTESLRQELLDVKEENYITVSNHLITIKELEESIQRLEKIINASSSGNKSEKDPVRNESPKASAEHVSDTCEYTYIINDGKVTITGYNGREEDIHIPSSIEGLPVVCIGESAFESTHATSIFIPRSVRNIDWFAFSNCISLREITIPSSVASIDYGAFNNRSTNLTVFCEQNSYAEAYAKSWGIHTEIE